MKRILVATDGSVSSTEAVQFGVELAAEHAAELMFVHVVPVVDMVPRPGLASAARTRTSRPGRTPRCSRTRPPSRSSTESSTTALLRGETVRRSWATPRATTST